MDYTFSDSWKEGIPMKIDRKDKTIISMFAQNPGISQEEIAKKVGLSQPSVAVRIRKLRESGALETQSGINPLKMGLYMAKVDITSNNTAELLDMFGNCPYVANGFSVSGKYNLCLFLVSENISALEAFVNYHIRSFNSVTDLSFNLIIDAEKDVIVPMNLTHSDSDVPPCGDATMCAKCPYFKAKKCLGCPATGEHKGWLS